MNLKHLSHLHFLIFFFCIFVASPLGAQMSTDGTMEMTDSAVTTDAKNAGGGKIGIDAKTRLHLSDSEITSSVREGAGNGGDVRICPTDGGEGPEFVILNHSRIMANADAGDGGAVFISTGNYLKSSDSVVEAKSRRGNQGSVRIESPDVDIVSSITPMPDTYTDAARWMKTPCKLRSGDEVSRFLIRGRDALSVSFDGWLQPRCLNLRTWIRKTNHLGKIYQAETEGRAFI